MPKGNINVKLPVNKVIKALETALEKLEKDWKEQQIKDANFKKLQQKHNKELAAIAIRNISKSKDLSADIRWNRVLNIDFSIPVDELKKLPEAPKRDYKVIDSYNYEQQKEEISNAIRILKMTEAETVNASTYNAISKYL